MKKSKIFKLFASAFYANKAHWRRYYLNELTESEWGQLEAKKQPQEPPQKHFTRPLIQSIAYPFPTLDFSSHKRYVHELCSRFTVDRALYTNPDNAQMVEW